MIKLFMQREKEHKMRFQVGDLVRFSARKRIFYGEGKRAVVTGITLTHTTPKGFLKYNVEIQYVPLRQGHWRETAVFLDGDLMKAKRITEGEVVGTV
jgi:hypothetical protein